MALEGRHGDPPQHTRQNPAEIKHFCGRGSSVGDGGERQRVAGSSPGSRRGASTAGEHCPGTLEQGHTCGRQLPGRKEAQSGIFSSFLSLLRKSGHGKRFRSHPSHVTIPQVRKPPVLVEMAKTLLQTERADLDNHQTEGQEAGRAPIRLLLASSKWERAP